MNEQDALLFLYYFRFQPTAEAVPAFFEWLRKERILRCKAIALPFAGAVMALRARFPALAGNWDKGPYACVMEQADRVSRHPLSKLDVLWCEHLIYRWMILESDRDLWELLCIAHNKERPDQLRGAQVAIQNITGLRSPTDPNSLLFDDFRVAITRLAKEYSAMSHAQRELPFGQLPFSEATRNAQKLQRSALTTSTLVQ